METKNNQFPAPGMEHGILIDEAAAIFNSADDHLKEELRALECVPDATYQVVQERVFVFDKLVEQVKRARARADMDLPALARSLIPAAIINAREAIDAGIVPVPYELNELPGGGYAIRHRPFNATIPIELADRDTAHDALARLLVGGVLEGSGEFTFGGQAMTLCEPLSVASLPSCPELPPPGQGASGGYTALGFKTFVDGLAPLPRAIFEQVKSLEAAWRASSEQAALTAERAAGRAWARLAAMELAPLRAYFGEVHVDDHLALASLRTLYPELRHLTDGALYWWFDAYQLECCFISGWTASRDDGFGFYLLGQLASGKREGEYAATVGRWSGYALLRGDSDLAALDFGRACALYNTALAGLARRVADAVDYLGREDRQALRGAPVWTTMDMFRMGRKRSAAPSWD